MDNNDAENSAIDEMMAMTDAELDLVQYEVAKWICSGKKCCRGTHVRDYGIAPIYYHKKITTTTVINDVVTNVPSSRWHDVERSWFMCAKHFKMWKRLLKNYPEHLVNQKLFDFTKTRIIKK